MTLSPAELSRRTFLLVVGRIPAFVAIFVLGIFLARSLSPEDYGIYQGAVWLAAFLPPLLVMGVGKSIDYFLPRTDRPRSLLLRSLLLTTAMGAATVAALLAIGGTDPIALVTAGIVFAVFGERLLPPVLVCLDEFKRLSVLLALSGPILLLGVLVPLLLELPLWVVLAGVLLHYLFLAAAAVMAILTAPRRQPGDPIPPLREQIGYALPVGVGGALSQLAVNLDKLVAFLGYSLAGFAVYKRGAMDVPILGTLSLLVLHAATPVLVRMHARGKRDDYLRLFDRSARLTALLTLPVFVFFLVTARDFVVLLYGETYAASASVFRLYLLLMPLRVVFPQSILETTGRARATMVLCGVLLALHLPGSIWLASSERPWGPALSMLVSNLVVWWGIGLPISARGLGVRIHELVSWGRLAKIALLSVLAGASIFLVDLLPLPRALFLLGAALLFFPATLGLFVLFRVLDADDLRTAKALLERPGAERGVAEVPDPE